MSITLLFAWNKNTLISIVKVDAQMSVEIDKQNLMNIFKGEKLILNPIDDILRSIIISNQGNQQLEIYALECDQDYNEEFWKNQCNDNPHQVRLLITSKGSKIYSSISK